MGQLLHRPLFEPEKPVGDEDRKKQLIAKFPDLNELPPEISLLILSNLNATDLCLAACVWQDLGNDEMLWMGLCRKLWGYSSAYITKRDKDFSYKKLYMQLDEGTLTFNADPELGLKYLIDHRLVRDNPDDIAKFLHFARHVDGQQKRQFLETRPKVLERIIELQNFENQFLPNALRKFFNQNRPPNERSSYLTLLVEKFSQRFCECNPTLGLSEDTVFVICFSLIMLSVDLCSPHVKNKMSKREFIKNTRRAANDINDDFAGHLYDNVYLIGHVAPQA